MNAVFIFEAQDDGAGGRAVGVDVRLCAAGGVDVERRAVAPIDIPMDHSVRAGIGNCAEGQGVGCAFVGVGIAGESDCRLDVGDGDGFAVEANSAVVVGDGEGDEVGCIVVGGEVEIGGEA